MLISESLFGGHSSVGRASDCGSECRGFEPHSPPENKNESSGRALFCFYGVVRARSQLLGRGPREFLILGESAAQGENVLQGLCPQSHEPLRKREPHSPPENSGNTLWYHRCFFV